MAASCVLPSASEGFAKQVINKLTDRQLANFGITSDNRKDNALKAIANLVERYVGREPDYNRQQQMLSNVDGFISDLENFFSVVQVSDSEYDEAKELYDKFYAEADDNLDTSRIDIFEFSQSEDDQKNAATTERILGSYNKVVSYQKQYYKNGKVKSISYVLMRPVRDNSQTAQQKSIDTIQSILSIESSQFPVDIEITNTRGDVQYVRRNKDIPEGWHKTGRHHYRYAGQTILTEPVTGYDPNADFPIMAAPIGTHVDSVGRMVFDRDSQIYNSEGEIVDDKTLQSIIDTDLGGIFTVSGLRNLISDFQKLENQFKQKWGDDIKVFSGDIKLFGQNENSDVWHIGKPDLLVIGADGVVHVVDFKTYKMTDIRGYQTFDNQRAEKYGRQVSAYIRMLQSYGLNVDESPYIVQIDTYYDSSDHGYSKNRDSKGNLLEDRNDIYFNEDGTLGIRDDSQEVTLGEYSQNEGMPSREEIISGERDVLYLEPRLHAAYQEGKGFSDELAALRDSSDVPFHKEMSYQQQWEALSSDEKQSMQWLFGSPVATPTAQGIITLSSDDIESRPDLIGSQEIQDVAEYIMYDVSHTITDLIRGKSFRDIILSQKNSDGSTPLMAKSRAQVIRLVGIQNLIDHSFKRIESRYNKNFPSEEDYHNHNYDDFDWEFENDEEYYEFKKDNEKAKWLVDHKNQFLMAGYTKLLALESCLIPIRRESDKFNGTTPDTSMESDVFDVTDDTGDNESNQTFADLYLEGITDVEAWMMGQRNYSPKASLAQEVKRMFESLYQMEDNGHYTQDPYGWGIAMPLDATTAIQAVYDATKNCETIEEMEKAMRKLATVPGNRWVTEVLDTINAQGNENLRKKFFRYFRKDTLNYSIAEVKFDKKTGKRTVTVRIINTKSAYQTMLNSLSASFQNGNVGTFTVNGQTFNTITVDPDSGKNILRKIGGKGSNSISVISYVIRQAELYKFNLDSYYESREYLYKGDRFDHKNQDERNEAMAQMLKEKKLRGKTMIQVLTECLHGIGVMVPESVVYSFCIAKLKGKRTNNTVSLFNKILAVAKKLEVDGSQWKSKLSDSLTGNKAFYYYQPLVQKLAPYVQEHVEASVYQDGKTYYAFTNPSKLGHIIRNLNDALDDKDKSTQYLHDNFGRYTGWYKTVDGKHWLCDWINQFEEGIDARNALEHKVELAYIGKQYKNLGALGFQLSILHNYFGSRSENYENKKWRWFALPTMSNKPTNEFVRMLTYGSNDAIIDKVLMPTFQQETNRIADVLYHYIHGNSAVDKFDITDKALKKAHWTEEEIENLKDRIDNHAITAADLIRLSKIKSGAKFHFLWYLNSEIASNDELSERIATRINHLLTPDSNSKTVDEAYETDTTTLVRQTIADSMEKIVDAEVENLHKMGLYDKEIRRVNGRKVSVLKYQDEFNGKLGTNEKEFDKAIRRFIWEDIAANINIIQITGGDLAYYGDAVNYQKRIAQVHSPGLHLMHDDNYDDGYLRSVHISDMNVRDEIVSNTRVALEEYYEKNLAHNPEVSDSARQDFQKMISLIMSGVTGAVVTDGQSYSSPSSIRKKLALQGEWDDTKEKAYQKIAGGHFNINDLGIMLQPAKPFVTSSMAKYSGSPTMELRRVPLQDKNSEYLIILAEALARGTGKRSKLTAICDFMEQTAKFGNGHQGIDTVHFASVNKVGASGIIDTNEFDRQYKGSDEDYNKTLTEYMLSKIRRKTDDKALQEQFNNEDTLVGEGKLKREEALYNNNYVDTIAIEDYIIQQEVPAHLLEHEQLYGSQIRILGISDITPGTHFQVNIEGGTEDLSDTELINEYKELHAKNITDAYESFKKELGLNDLEKFTGSGDDFTSILELPVGHPKRNEILTNLEFLLQKELSKDAKYGRDARIACSLQHDANGNPVDFNVPLLDPIQSNRIQMLINSIIKKSINKQRINGGPVVQTTAYDENLHIRFKGKDGELLPLQSETSMSKDEYYRFLKANQNGIAYFECYLPVPNAALERLMINDDGSMMTIEEVQKALGKEVWDAMSQVIGYRIPTEDKYSMLPLKIVGFMPKAAGQAIMMPQEITYLTGSDFDIDKLYLMMKAFDTQFDTSKDSKDALVNAYKESHETFKGMNAAMQQIMANGKDIMSGRTDISWTHGITHDDNWDKVVEMASWYRKFLISDGFTEFTVQESKNRKDAKKARDNRLLDLQWAVLTNEDTTSKMLNPGNFNDEKKTGRVIRAHKNHAVNPDTGAEYTEQELYAMSLDDLDAILENSNPHNTTLPSSKIYFQQQNMQGTQMTGIFANNVVSHAFCTFQHIAIDLNKDRYNNSFSIDGHLIGDHDNPTPLDAQHSFNGQLISKTLASGVGASTDTAKDPVHKDLNISTFTGDVATTLMRMGFDIQLIGYFLAQPVVIELSELYFKNSTDGFYNTDTAIEEMRSSLDIDKKDFYNTEDIRDASVLTRENLYNAMADEDYRDYEGALDFQKRVFKAYYQLYCISKDVKELTFLTKFNSVTNAAGPTIADSMHDIDRVNKFIDGIGGSVFYEPTDSENFTNAAEVIDNDPILKAFYSATIGPKGASETIFKNFFPHYFQGFRYVIKAFSDTYMNGKRPSTKLYNQFLNDYIYYLLTYQGDSSNRILPTLPSSQADKERLIGGLVKDFQSVLKIKNRKPNAILDQSLGASCLRVRGADEFLAKDTLIFNGGQLNSEGQQRIKNAWSDLITMNDPNLSEEENTKIRRFGTDLFFYTLMRNGFGFSPKTLMHLASVIVRYNATYASGFSNYILGLRNLKNVDNFLMGDNSTNLLNVHAFCRQFLRNHANNQQLVPNVNFEAGIVDSVGGGEITFGVPDSKEYKLDKILLSKKHPYQFITVTRKVDNRLQRQLYELQEVGGEEITRVDYQTFITYKKSSALGLTNNFIEYDANSELETSYFENIRNESEEAVDDEETQKEDGGDEKQQYQESAGYDEAANSKWILINRVLRGKLEGPQNEKAYRQKLKEAYMAADSSSELVQKFNSLIDNSIKDEDKQNIMDEINREFSKQDKC